MNKSIPFNKPYLTGKETYYINDAVNTGKISGNGKYTKKCQTFFEDKYGFKKCLLTTSCTDALEMAAILINLKEGDEVIMPSYTFVSTANAFILRGAKIVFVDSKKDHPGMDEDAIEKLITDKTKAIVPVHYAGVSCDMDKIMDLAETHRLFVIEDAAQAIDSYYVGKDGIQRALGSIGHLSAFSFHETKNIISGEGGMLAINDSQFEARAEIIWEKGTNRSSFFRGEVAKYEWVDLGSSFLPSEIIASFLWAQLENLNDIQNKRKAIWTTYSLKLNQWASNNNIKLPSIPEYATNNAHMFYLTFDNNFNRTKAIEFLKSNNILAVFHYISLHTSSFYKSKHDGRKLLQSDRYTNTLLRLPMYYELSDVEIDRIINSLKEYKV
ncbi:dTDP-4-amino-4,6-dideoxygalactose transaminase [Winogradskyella sp. UBA3174]|uniref:dTDP-4-amino-4,6-dideoxygalactose transaminase n=1 Tax=Winogradskyella sp. UBA3174 TaxID=1947785 RepID=UPI0025E487C6|nr:dTDP-4-amino-4,6-dideoxygalactose transaminase [Winogradskyella sp. UBA3174]|tara:strand:+ start:66413 stop:67561 length:1149 start_codon:yes stop_codon:yes gene_type:complete